MLLECVMADSASSPSVRVPPTTAHVCGSWSSDSSRSKGDPSITEAKVPETVTGVSRSSSPSATRRRAAMTSGSFIVEAA